MAKSFRGATVLCQARLAVLDFQKNVHELDFELIADGVLRQKGRLANVIFSLESLKEYALAHFPVESGDWLLTGTPAGVGALIPGQKLTLKLADLFSENFEVVAEENA